MQINPHDGCLYFTDYDDNAVKRVTLKGISILAQNNINLHCCTGEVSTLMSGYLCGIALNNKEQIFYVSDESNNTIYQVTSTGICHFVED